MFRLHQSTWRQLCRAAFLALGLAPVVALLAAGAWQRLPSQAALHRQELGRRLGLRIALGGVSYPRPGVTRYERVELADPESRDVVLACETIDCESLPGGQQRVTFVAPSLDLNQFDTFWRLAQRTLERDVLDDVATVQLRAASLELRSPQGSQHVDNVEGMLITTQRGRSLELRFAPTEGLTRGSSAESSALPGRLVLKRELTLPPRNSYKLATASVTVPANLVARLVEMSASFGARSRFAGTITVADGLASIQGRLTDVDLQQLLGGGTGREFVGTATIELEPLLFEHGYVAAADVRVSAGRGKIGSAWLDAAERQLGLALTSEPSASRTLVPFEKLMLRAIIDKQRWLHVEGQCDDTQPGTILQDDRGALVQATFASSPRSMLDLVRFLAPSNAPQVPWSPRAEALLRWIGPPATPTATRTARSPRS